MTTTSNDERSEPSSEAFERELATLLRDSFANGTEIEGKWDITSHSELVPDWQVVIEKNCGAALPDIGGFLDE